ENARELESFENIADPEDGGDGQNHPERVPKLVVYFKTHTSAKSQIETGTDVRVYPNPAEKGEITVELSKTNYSNIFMYDITGRLVKTVNVEGTVNRINVSDMKSGMYIIRVADSEKSLTKKVIIR
ncbi:MAG: T9SS type A sorting domain-containing protein, partial [Bacteroidales bacterium]|nr:T9SS type A sorting domain-containing protein [Bacteroidales bacterium]